MTREHPLMSDLKVPVKCPSCKGKMRVVELECPDCGLHVKGSFELCPVCSLNEKMYELFKLFLEARGNVRSVQKALNVSYPTVRQRMEELFTTLEEETVSLDARTILAKVRAKELTVDQAEELLRGI
jgi:hypothetical protein